jgi:hypothetical protein
MVSLPADRAILAARKGWYSSMVDFADWRGVPPVDMSSNPMVSHFYSGHRPLAFRSDNIATIRAALATGDTTSIGLDYYVLTGLCNGLLPVDTVRPIQGDLDRGRVVVVRAVFRDGQLHFMPPETRR